MSDALSMLGLQPELAAKYFCFVKGLQEMCTLNGSFSMHIFICLGTVGGLEIQLECVKHRAERAPGSCSAFTGSHFLVMHNAQGANAS